MAKAGVFAAVPGLFEQQEAGDNASRVLFHLTTEVRNGVTSALPLYCRQAWHVTNLWKQQLQTKLMLRKVFE